MTAAEREELKQCSRRIAELLYKEAVEENRPLKNLGGIELTVRSQLQEHVSPTIGAFFVKQSVEQPPDIPKSSTVSSDA